MVLLSPMELDPTMKMILQVPMWAQRVIYIQGSCLKVSLFFLHISLESYLHKGVFLKGNLFLFFMSTTYRDLA